MINFFKFISWDRIKYYKEEKDIFVFSKDLFYQGNQRSLYWDVRVRRRKQFFIYGGKFRRDNLSWELQDRQDEDKQKLGRGVVESINWFD